MRKSLTWCLTIVFFAGCAAAGDDFGDGNARIAAQGLSHMRVCPGPAAEGSARCHALVVTDRAGKPVRSSAPPATAKTPDDLWSAYSVPVPSPIVPGSGNVVAIVDAYGYPNAERDLNVYRSQFGLGECTAANGCFRKINQRGAVGNDPRANTGWSQEAALDIEMASAICPNCKILLVQADSSSFANLSTAVDQAASYSTADWPRAVAISNSYGGGEYSGELSDQSHYHHPGIAVTVSSGDSGFGVEFPAASQYVTAVGGTSLVGDSTSGWSETAWNGAGSGCSSYIPKPSWQNDAGCANRSVADVSAVADPSTGVAVYAPSNPKSSKWYQFGGTSVAAPIVGAVYALAPQPGVDTAASYTYNHTASLNDVLSGTNGNCGTYLCTAGSGYDGPTGLGTPDGVGAF